MPLSINTLVASTLFYQTKDVSDEVTKGDAILTQLSSKGRIVKVAGGYELREPIMYQGPDMQWFDGWEQLNTTQPETHTAFAYSWGLAAVPIAISKKEELMNSGSEDQLIDLAAGRTDAAKAAMKNGLAIALRGDGTTPKSIVGLAGLFPATATTGTIGGVARSGNTFAQHQSISFATTLSKSWSAATIQEGLLYAWSLTCRGNQQIDLWLVTRTPYMYYHQSLTPIQRMSGDTALAKAGFKTLEYMGGEVVLDTAYGESETSGTGYSAALMYGLMTDTLKLKAHKNLWMQKLGSDREPVDQAGTIQYLGAMCALTCNAPAFNVRMAA